MRVLARWTFICRLRGRVHFQVHSECWKNASSCLLEDWGLSCIAAYWLGPCPALSTISQGHPPGLPWCCLLPLQSVTQRLYPFINTGSHQLFHSCGWDKGGTLGHFLWHLHSLGFLLFSLLKPIYQICWLWLTVLFVTTPTWLTLFAPQSHCSWSLWDYTPLGKFRRSYKMTSWSHLQRAASLLNRD